VSSQTKPYQTEESANRERERDAIRQKNQPMERDATNREKSTGRSAMESEESKGRSATNQKKSIGRSAVQSEELIGRSAIKSIERSIM
jgi:hypothetical protein